LTRFAALAILALCIGCKTTSSGTGEAYENINDLKPATMIPATASLQIGKIDMPVEVRQSQAGQDLNIELLAHGQVLETESYKVTDKAFLLAHAAGEHYKDPLPLLKFPMKVGDTWNWVGTMTAGDAPHKAQAVVSTTSESILLPTAGATETVLVVVDLSIAGGGPTPAKRRMRFWFAKNMGLVKRQFGDASSREPAK